MPSHPTASPRSASLLSTPLPGAVVAGLGANILWGVSPLFWGALKHIPAGQVLAHRIFWSIILVAMGAGFSDAWRGFKLLGKSPRLWLLSFVASLLVGANWLINIWAVNAGHVVEASLGYYMSPILSVALARVMLGERLRPIQNMACAAVLAGVMFLVWRLGHVPWTGLGLAFTFATYGLMRKSSPLIGTQGFRVETLMLMPIAIAYIVWQHRLGVGAFELGDFNQRAWLVAAGIFSGMPLLLFSRAAVHLRLTTLSILQYLMPTCQLALATLVLGEPLTWVHGVAFTFIWLGLALYSGEGILSARRLRGRRAV